MAVSVLVTAAGAANANAYTDVAFADQYNADRPPVGNTWALATADQKAAAIIWATLLLDRLWIWNGWVTSAATQARQFPRRGLLRFNDRNYVDPSSIPLEIQQATAEYARQLLVSDLTGNSAIETLGITSLRAGPVSFSFKESQYAKPVPDVVVALIPIEWGSPRGRSGGTRDLVRA